MSAKPLVGEEAIFQKMLPSNPLREWRDVPGFEGRYMVSDDGYVGSISRDVAGPKGSTRRIRSRILKSVVRMRDGKVFSVCVNLCRGDEPTLGANVGRLVLMAFDSAEPEEGALAHYRDGDPSNNKLSNMEWSTQSAITQEAVNGGYGRPAKDQPRLI